MNNYIINNCIEADIPQVLAMYEEARKYMKSKRQVYWPYFSESSILKEINQGRLWRIKINNEIACIWSTTFSDPLIWAEKNSDPALYIHKIATHHKHRGNHFVQTIVNWAKTYATTNNKDFIRMDTVGNNQALINHYKKHGFNFLGTAKLKTTQGLPDHYKDGDTLYFEIKL